MSVRQGYKINFKVILSMKSAILSEMDTSLWTTL